MQVVQNITHDFDDKLMNKKMNEIGKTAVLTSRGYIQELEEFEEKETYKRKNRK